jgi:hypothetical protein
MALKINPDKYDKNSNVLGTRTISVFVKDQDDAGKAQTVEFRVEFERLKFMDGVIHSNELLVDLAYKHSRMIYDLKDAQGNPLVFTLDADGQPDEASKVYKDFIFNEGDWAIKLGAAFNAVQSKMPDSEYKKAMLKNL